MGIIAGEFGGEISGEGVCGSSVGIEVVWMRCVSYVLRVSKFSISERT